jgi:molybdopterin synthase catalytic subunit/molybdopterin synthase sulfur carrier subunit
MRVTVLHFGVLRERRGTEVEELELDGPITLAELYAQLFPPGPEGVLPIAFARNQTYARGSEAIADGDELAFLPPVGGG